MSNDVNIQIPHKPRPLKRNYRPCDRCGFPKREAWGSDMVFCINALCSLTYFKWAVDPTRVPGGENYCSDEKATNDLPTS